MSSEKEVYIMQDDEDEEWVRPTPAQTAIARALVSETDLAESDLGEVDTYVSLDELRTVLESKDEDEVTFTVEGHEVTVEANGEITVQG